MHSTLWLIIIVANMSLNPRSLKKLLYGKSTIGNLLESLSDCIAWEIARGKKSTTHPMSKYQVVGDYMSETRPCN
ncbi:hypothetical protein F4679DRAFT_526323 [Xylaria curta]|nr:hypothetical protein F4679DRAFT_526323 [Xylaria curta]